jgi:dienelactone hydrolase
MTHSISQRTVRIDISQGTIEGDLAVPEVALGVVLFAHGSGSSRFSARNRFVADTLHHEGLGTLLIDLLTAREEQIDAVTSQHRFDISLLTERLVSATVWLRRHEPARHLPVGYFGASTGAAAALAAAAQRSDVAAVVSRGGRPDLAGEALRLVQSPTLLVVGGNDFPVISLNQAALRMLEKCVEKDLVIVPGATHLFEEPGALSEVARLAGNWFQRHFTATAASASAMR